MLYLLLGPRTVQTLMPGVERLREISHPEH
jgi:hypothetical protein